MSASACTTIPPAGMRHLADHRPRRVDVAVERAEAQRIGRFAHGLQHDQIRRPRVEPVGAVGDQEMPVGFAERPKRPPAAPGFLGAHEVFQRVGTIVFPLERREQVQQGRMQRPIADQVQPADPPPPGFLLRESGMSPLHRLLHQRQQMPRHRAPRGCQGRNLMLIARRVPEIDLSTGGGLDHVEALGDRA